MIRIEHVTHRFGDHRALDRVDLSVDAGEIVGLLGPNGAGKSTLFKLLSTYLRPTEGRLSIAGHDVVEAPLAARAHLGYLTEHNALYDGMSVEAYLRFRGEAQGLRGRTLGERIDWVTERCELESVRRKRIRTCSKGFRQRIGVAAALIHDPPAIVLDEPTHGLDPRQVVAFRDFLRGLREDRAIVFSSHIVAEVAQICDRIVVLHEGRVLLDESIEAVRDRAASEGVDFEAHLLSHFDRSVNSDAAAGEER